MAEPVKPFIYLGVRKGKWHEFVVPDADFETALDHRAVAYDQCAQMCLPHRMPVKVTIEFLNGSMPPIVKVLVRVDKSLRTQ